MTLGVDECFCLSATVAGVVVALIALFWFAACMAREIRTRRAEREKLFAGLPDATQDSLRPTLSRNRLWANIRPLLFGPWLPVDHRTAPEALASLAFDSSPARKDGLKSTFEVELEYAKSRYEESTESFTLLDSKLDGLMKFAGTFFAAVVGLAKAGGITLEIKLLVPGLLFICFGMIWCVYARLATTKGTPLEIDRLMNFAADRPDDGEPASDAKVSAYLAGSIHKTLGQIKAVNVWKGIQFNRASVAVVVGLIFTLVSLVTGQSI